MLRTVEENQRLFQAQEIFNAYGSALKNDSGGPAMKYSWLPCSILKIRLSICIIIEAIIQDHNNKLPQSDYEMFSSAIFSLNSFFKDEDAELINSIFNKPVSEHSNEDKKIILEFSKTNLSSDGIDEFAEYVNDLLGGKKS